MHPRVFHPQLDAAQTVFRVLTFKPPFQPLSQGIVEADDRSPAAGGSTLGTRGATSVHAPAPGPKNSNRRDDFESVATRMTGNSNTALTMVAANGSHLGGNFIYLSARKSLLILLLEMTPFWISMATSASTFRAGVDMCWRSDQWACVLERGIIQPAPKGCRLQLHRRSGFPRGEVSTTRLRWMILVTMPAVVCPDRLGELRRDAR